MYCVDPDTVFFRNADPDPNSGWIKLRIRDVYPGSGFGYLIRIFHIPDPAPGVKKALDS
jgi:hypothetical protein